MVFDIFNKDGVTINTNKFIDKWYQFTEGGTRKSVRNLLELETLVRMDKKAHINALSAFLDRESVDDVIEPFIEEYNTFELGNVEESVSSTLIQLNIERDLPLAYGGLWDRILLNQRNPFERYKRGLNNDEKTEVLMEAGKRIGMNRSEVLYSMRLEIPLKRRSPTDPILELSPRRGADRGFTLTSPRVFKGLLLPFIERQRDKGGLSTTRTVTIVIMTLILFFFLLLNRVLFAITLILFTIFATFIFEYFWYTQEKDLEGRERDHLLITFKSLFNLQ